MWGARKKSLSISHTHAGRKSTIRNNCQLFFSPPQILFTKSIFGKLNRAIIEVNLRSFDALLQLQNLSAVPSPRCFAYSQFRNLKRTLAGNLKGNMLSDDCAVWPSDRFVILIFVKNALLFTRRVECDWRARAEIWIPCFVNFRRVCVAQPLLFW